MRMHTIFRNMLLVFIGIFASISLGLALYQPIVDAFHNTKVEWYTLKYSCQWKCGTEPSKEIAELINYEQLKVENLARAYASK